MSHDVQYVMSANDVDERRFPRADVGHGIPEEGTDVEFEIETPSGEVACILSRDAGYLVLWTNINYYRLLYQGEMADAVAYLDRWVAGFCPSAVRIDGSLLDAWMAGLDNAGPRHADMAKLLGWLGNKEAEGTYWKRVSYPRARRARTRRRALTDDERLRAAAQRLAE
jgi:hypothetical protein